MKKSKGLFSLGISILFVMLGIYLFQIKAETIDSSFALISKIVGVICIVFFGSIVLLSLSNFLRR